MVALNRLSLAPSQSAREVQHSEVSGILSYIPAGYDMTYGLSDDGTCHDRIPTNL